MSEYSNLFFFFFSVYCGRLEANFQDVQKQLKKKQAQENNELGTQRASLKPYNQSWHQMGKKKRANKTVYTCSWALSLNNGLSNTQKWLYSREPFQWPSRMTKGKQSFWKKAVAETLSAQATPQLKTTSKQWREMYFVWTGTRSGARQKDRGMISWLRWKAGITLGKEELLGLNTTLCLGKTKMGSYAG